MKKNILVIILLLIIVFGFIQGYLSYLKESLYINDFESVAGDYSKITDM